MNRKKLLSIVITGITALSLVGCSNNKSANSKSAEIHTVMASKKRNIDYPSAKKAEAALNKGKNLKGKTVKFKITKIEPRSAFGYNMETGKHLNFVSHTFRNVKKGNIVSVKITKVRTYWGSFVINYSNLHKIK